MRPVLIFTSGSFPLQSVFIAAHQKTQIQLVLHFLLHVFSIFLQRPGSPQCNNPVCGRFPVPSTCRPKWVHERSPASPRTSLMQVQQDEVLHMQSAHPWPSTRHLRPVKIHLPIRHERLNSSHDPLFLLRGSRGCQSRLGPWVFWKSSNSHKCIHAHTRFSIAADIWNSWAAFWCFRLDQRITLLRLYFVYSFMGQLIWRKEFRIKWNPFLT